VLQLISLFIALAIGFAGGYGVRELKSRRNRAIAREEYLRRQQQKICDSTASR
jgi:flagellar biogenesis protein FliO